ncbi:hypothetical protein WDH52_24560, partial [Streptomyces sp. TRM70308]
TGPAREETADRPPEHAAAPVPWVLSAKTRSALAAQAHALHGRLLRQPELGVHEVAFSLATTRAALDHRAAVVGTDREELLAGVAALARRDADADVLSAHARPGAQR